MQNTENIFVSIKKLSDENLEQIEKLDKLAKDRYGSVLSGEVAGKLKNRRENAICKELVSVYGVFFGKEMIGYCTLDGYGNNASLGTVLSNVFIMPSYQRKGIGTDMVRFVLEQAPKPVYICCLGNQFHFYEQFGFKRTDDYPMDMMILE